MDIKINPGPMRRLIQVASDKVVQVPTHECSQSDCKLLSLILYCLLVPLVYISRYLINYFKPPADFSNFPHLVDCKIPSDVTET